MSTRCDVPLGAVWRGRLLLRSALTAVHAAQGAELMSKYGINVPDGLAAKSISEVVSAAEKMKDESGEVLRSPAAGW